MRMKKWLDDPKNLFALLMTASVIAMLMGVYLAAVLGIYAPLAQPWRTDGYVLIPIPVYETVLTIALSVISLGLWLTAWGAFYGLCTRLHRGEKAFQERTGRTLRLIGWCMIGMMAAVLVQCVPEWVHVCRAQAMITTHLLIRTTALPGLFLLVAAVAHVLRRLLLHAIALEKQQEGVV